MDDDVRPLIQRVKDRLAPGSLVVICQSVSDRADVRDRMTALMKEATHGNGGRSAKRRTRSRGRTPLA